MTLSPGTQFGPYAVADEIGAGGMGVVYRATDTNLKRDVAFKVLPESLATDTERLTRFQREAELLASLNHPHIAQIYGLEQSDGMTALVMELIDGPTLADRIEQGEIPADEALGIAMQILAALEGAHGKGIVHRDLKPANIKLRPDGTVKVLDFGIAKALEPDTVTSEPESPMLTTPATQVGVILGTAAYMSPEQARGKQVDQRADIWAFGCVLFEMLTGQPAFAGEDVPVTLARVIANDAELGSLPGTISPSVVQTIELCLQKDVRKRIADIRDVRLALEGAFEAVTTKAAEATARPMWRRALPIVAAALMTGLVVGLSAWVGMQPPPKQILRFAMIHPGEEAISGALGDAKVALSPDGRHIAYMAGPPPHSSVSLYVRALDQLAPTLLSTTARSPFFSPDGHWVGFVEENRRLSKVALTGGPSVAITELVGSVRGAIWAADDTIIFGTNDSKTGLQRVPAAGGDTEILTTPDTTRDEADHLYPELLPGERTVLFTIKNTEGPDRSQIALLDLETGKYRVLIHGGSYARYSESGHIVYGVAGTLRAVPFDADRLEVTGNPVPVLDGVITHESGSAAFSLAPNGTLVYLSGDVGSSLLELVWVDREGHEEPLGAELRVYGDQRLSPDGQRLAIRVGTSSQSDLWVYDLLRGTASRLTFDLENVRTPLWAPDDQRVFFTSLHDGGGIYSKAADGTGRVETLLADDGQLFMNSFSPDGDRVTFERRVDGWDIYVLSLKDGTTQALIDGQGHQGRSSLSPDGRWIVYQSNENGREEVFVRPFPETEDGKWQISRTGGLRPQWGPDGKEIFFLGGGNMMAVDVESDSGFSAGIPTALFSRAAYVIGALGYSVSPDGQRFLVKKPVTRSSADDAANQPSLVVVENWSQELERLAPTAD